MKVAILLPDLSTRGGVEQMSVNIAALFTERIGCEVIILTCFASNQAPAYEIPKGVGMHHLGAKHYPGGLKRIAWYLGIRKKIAGWLAENACDVLLVQGGYLSSAVALMKGRDGLLRIGCEHVDPQAANLFHRLLSRVTYPRLDGLVVLTESYRRYYESWLRSVKCIPNFIDTNHAIPALLQSSLLVSCGRLTRQKGFDLMLEAIASSPEIDPSWWMVVYGEGEERLRLGLMVAKFGLQERVYFAGETRDVPARLSEASMFVLPSRFEGFPVVLLEAMAAGLPCICFRSPGVSELIVDGLNGVIVPNGDTKALGRAIGELSRNASLRGRLGEAARARAAEFSKERVAERWKEMLGAGADLPSNA